MPLEAYEERNKKFSNYIGQIKSVLHKLELEYKDSYLRDDQVQGVMDLISNNHNVQRLSICLTANQLTDVGVSKIFSTLGKVHNISTLSLIFDWNFEISNESVKVLIITLKKLSNLSEFFVRMSYNTRVDDEGELMFVNAVKELPNIKKCTWDSKDILS